jgi:DNA primase
MIPDDVVERVRQEADIVSIVGEFVKLKRSGSSFRGPCPFHQGKHDNFAVTPGGGYVCFVCGEKGDAFTFVQKRLGLDFVESVKWVGEKCGIDVREVSRRVEGPDPRERLWELNATVAAYFTAQLWETESGGAARRYLDSRGFDRAAADRFGIGYAPREIGAMRDYLHGLGFDDERQLAAGVVITRDDRADPRPRFRDRLMFPIADQAAHVVGFGGRVLGSGEPKYLNSGESEVFAKRNLLYGLGWAKGAIRRADRLLIVEGYFDVLRVMLAGIEEVVAPLGTALTEAQAALIRKYTNTVYLLYDSDQAGLKATFRTGDVLLASGINVRVVSLPDGDDPDTFVARAGNDGLESAIAQSVDVFDRKIQILERTGYFADLRRKREALDKLLPTIRVTADRLLRDLYIARTSEVAGVSRDLLERELEALPARQVAPHTDPPSVAARVPLRPDAQPARASRAHRSQQSRDERAERELLRMLLHLRQHVETVAERDIGPESFINPIYGRLFDALVAGGADATPEELANGLTPEEVTRLQELLEESGGLDRGDETVLGAVNVLLARQKRADLLQIERDLPLAEDEGKDDLIRDKERVAKELGALGQPLWKGFNSPQP